MPLNLRPDGDLQEVGAVAVATKADAVINGLLAATDRLVDIITTVRVNLDSQVPYFSQVVAAQSATVGGITIRLQYNGYSNDGTLNNAVGLFDLTGKRLAVGDALNTYRNLGGWSRIAFTAPVAIVAGTRYVLGLLVDGNSPGFNAATGHSEINALIPGNALPRCFKKTGVPNFSAATLDFTTNVTAYNGDRPFISLVV